MPRDYVSPHQGAPEKIEVDAAGVRIGFDSVDAPDARLRFARVLDPEGHQLSRLQKPTP